MNRQIIKEMRSKLDEYSMQPPDVPWQVLEQALDNDRLPDAGNHKKRKSGILPMWWERAAAVATVALLTAGAWWMFSGEEEQTKQILPTSAPVKTTMTGKSDNSQNPSDSSDMYKPVGEAFNKTLETVQAYHILSDGQDSDLSLLSENKVKYEIPEKNTRGTEIPIHLRSSTEHETTEKPDSSIKTDFFVLPVTSDYPSFASTPDELDMPDNSISPVQPVVSPAHTDTGNQPQITQQPSTLPSKTLPPTDSKWQTNSNRSASTRLTLKASVSNEGAGGLASSLFRNSDVSADTYYNSVSEPYPPDDSDNDDNKPTDDKTDDKAKAKKMKSRQTDYGKVRHHQPIRFGMSLSYHLNDRWSFDAGISYTRVNTDITQGDNASPLHTEQQLNYIGIPFSVNYSIWHNSWFNLYASAGIMAEKMIKGERIQRNLSYGQIKSQWNTEKISIHPLLFSIKGAAGAEFKFNRMFSVYAEPEVSYHFDNTTSVPTFYHDYPMSFNLSFGLRINIR